MKKRQNSVYPPRFPYDYKDVMFWCFMVLCIITLTLCLTSCSPMSKVNNQFGLPEDNWIEETIEYGAEKIFNVKVDLTGDSPE